MVWIRRAPTLALGKREVIYATQTIVSPATQATDAINVERCNTGEFSLQWSALTAFNARFILQASTDGTNWNDLGGQAGGIILSSEDDTQIWEFTSIPFTYLRADFTANNVTTGTLNLIFRGFATG